MALFFKEKGQDARESWTEQLRSGCISAFVVIELHDDRGDGEVTEVVRIKALRGNDTFEQLLLQAFMRGENTRLSFWKCPGTKSH